jgi:hypothetical protein
MLFGGQVRADRLKDFAGYPNTIGDVAAPEPPRTLHHHFKGPVSKYSAIAEESLIQQPLGSVVPIICEPFH